MDRLARSGVTWVVAAALLGSVLLAPAAAAASSAVLVYVNGHLVFTDVPPRLESDRLLVPLRALFEALGVEVHWDAATRTVRAGGADLSLVLQVDRELALLGADEVELEVPPRLVSGRVLVPVRFVAEALGGTVEWDAVHRAVRIQAPVLRSPDASVAGEQVEGSGLLTVAEVLARVPEADILLLARLITAEAHGQPFEGLVAVGAVVLNRVADPRFPATIRDVIYQPGQFLVVRNGRIDLAPTQVSVEAAVEALRGRDPTGGALFFYNPARSTSTFWKGRPVLAIIGDHVFTR